MDTAGDLLKTRYPLAPTSAASRQSQHSAVAPISQSLASRTAKGSYTALEFDGGGQEYVNVQCGARTADAEEARNSSKCRLRIHCAKCSSEALPIPSPALISSFGSILAHPLVSR